ncbi:unnamed protein product [Cladocopium goreaui]|uniref:Ubiquitin-like domain-containing protein n=1 Tax=Cladocopium goreaui TaxID=2562237 RepID=A0A9P1C851_9DINO|nr:unnamed protein product [Cladocopium goreaui]
MSTLKPPLPRSESELGKNLETKGTNSYYYAHNESWEVPGHAKVRSGPGLVTGGAPVKLGADGQTQQVQGYQSPHGGDDVTGDVVAELRKRVEELESELVQARAGTKAISQFSFSDEGAKCKVYVDVEKDVLERQLEQEDSNSTSEAAVVVSFCGRSCSLRITLTAPDGAVLERRALTLVGDSDIVPKKCTYKVDRSKGRITLSFYKEDAKKIWHNVKPQKT